MIETGQLLRYSAYRWVGSLATMIASVLAFREFTFGMAVFVYLLIISASATVNAMFALVMHCTSSINVRSIHAHLALRHWLDKFYARWAVDDDYPDKLAEPVWRDAMNAADDQMAYWTDGLIEGPRLPQFNGKDLNQEIGAAVVMYAGGGALAWLIGSAIRK